MLLAKAVNTRTKYECKTVIQLHDEIFVWLWNHIAHSVYNVFKHFITIVIECQCHLLDTLIGFCFDGVFVNRSRTNCLENQIILE